MKTWVLLVILLIGLVVIIFYFKQRPSSVVEKFEDFFNNQQLLDDIQNTLFNDQLGKSLFVNDNLALGNINPAFAQPELSVQTSLDRDFNVYLDNDPTHTFVEMDTTLCRKAKSPLDMPKIDNSKGKASIGCGWWYIDDSNTPSQGALGTIDGALFVEGLPKNGVWIWDRERAAAVEDIKYCKNIKTCEALSIDEVKRKCGFCPDDKRMVPVTETGSLKHPGWAGCGVPIVTELSECTKPPPVAPVKTSDNKSCGNLGYPSPDNSMRLYTKADCDSLDGTLTFNNECQNKKGGSYSFDCKDLNPKIVKSVSICAPNAKGVLSLECLISLAKSIGYYDGGAIIRILKTPTAPYTDMDTQSFDILKKNDIVVPDTILGRGNADSKTALSMYFDLLKYTTGANKMVAKATGWLIYGNMPDFCDVDKNDKGPFSADCLRRAFRMAGCQASGEGYPSPANLNTFAGLSWSDVMAKFNTLFTSMNSADKTTSDEATKNCLGIKFFRPSDDESFKYVAGVDINSQNLQSFNGGADSDICRKACLLDNKCKSYVVVQPGFNDDYWKDGGCATKGFGLERKIDNTKTDTYVKKDDNYYFLQGMDSGGNDIKNIYANDVRALKLACDTDPKCNGFNTNGWMKNIIKPPQERYNWTADPAKGMYVKKPKHKYLGCFGDSGQRAIPKQRADVSYSGNGQDGIDACKIMAKENGDNIFGLQYGGPGNLGEGRAQCFTGKDPDYGMYGTRQGCSPMGNAWTSQVYSIDSPSNYIVRSDTDSNPGYDNNIACFTNGESDSTLREKCDQDPNCMAYVTVLPNTAWGNKSGGCLKKNATSLINQRGLTLSIKTNTTDPEGYKYTPNKDHNGSDLGCMGGGTTLEQCRTACNKNPSCKAINFIHPNTHWGGDSGCCFKNESSINNSNMPGLDYWVK